MGDDEKVSGSRVNNLDSDKTPQPAGATESPTSREPTHNDVQAEKSPNGSLQAEKDVEQHSSSSPESSSSTTQSARPGPTALDFFADGTCLKHASDWVPSSIWDGCDLDKSDSTRQIRVVIYDTPTVETTLLPDPSASSLSSQQTQSKRIRLCDCCDSKDQPPSVTKPEVQSSDLEAGPGTPVTSSSTDLQPKPQPTNPANSQTHSQDDLEAAVESAPDLHPDSQVADEDASSKSKSKEDVANDSASVESENSQAKAEMLFHEVNRFHMHHHEVGKTFDILNSSSPSNNLRLSTNVAIIMDKPLDKLKDAEWRPVGRKMRNEIQLYGFRSIFYTHPYTVNYRWHGSDLLEVEFLFYAANNGAPFDLRTPLSNAFRARIESEDAFMALFRGDVEIGAQLLFLDVCSADVDCSLDFLTTLRDAGIHQRLVWPQDAPNSHILPEDSERLAVFSRSARELILAQNTVLEALENTEAFPITSRSQLKRLVFVARAKQTALRNVMQDLNEDAKRHREDHDHATNRTQEQSIKRLTIMAAIFLPLSLSSSILSMTTRARHLGALWWDFLGIFIVIVTVVLAIYVTAAFFKPYKYGPADQYISRKLETYVRDLIRRASDETGDDDYSHHFPWWIRRTYELLPVVFLLMATACFLTGMFTSVSTGAEALGYGTAGTVGWLLISLCLAHLTGRFASSLVDMIAYMVGYVLALLYLLAGWFPSQKGWIKATVKGVIAVNSWVWRMILRFFFGRKVEVESRLFKQDFVLLVKRVMYHYKEAIDSLKKQLREIERPGRKKEGNASSNTADVEVGVGAGAEEPETGDVGGEVARSQTEADVSRSRTT